MHLGTRCLRALGLGISALYLLQGVAAFPLDFNDTLYDDLPLQEYSLDKRANAGDFYLRIMPVGASIVKGWPIHNELDPTGNGFRKYVRDQLRYDGWDVNMVGGKNHGSMADNDVEAVEGDRIDQVHARVRNSAPIWKPNLYLINAGTNDATQRWQDGAGERLKAMIETMFASTPDATIILSTLIQNGGNRNDGSAIEPEILNINDQIRRVAAEEMGSDSKNPRHKVYLAEMHDGFITYPADYKDTVHPHAAGNKKMAAVWMRAINKVNELGWLKKPSGDVKFPDGEDHATCRKVPGSGGSNPHGAGVQVLFAGDATIRDDGAYAHESKSQGVFWSTDSASGRDIFWAQLVDFGAPREEALDELVVVNEDTERMTMYVNRGGGKYDAGIKIEVGHKCITRGIRWGDVNGDGLDDYICIAPDGTPFVAINTSGRGQVKPSFGAFFKWRNPIAGYDQSRVHLGDIDGDGRLDYCVMHDNADIYCYRNGGTGNGAAYWQDFGKEATFTGKNMGDMRGVRFVDINGDGRSDWVWIGKSGETTIYINKRGKGTGLIPYWEKAAKSHPGMGEDTGETRWNVQFGRIYGNGFRDYSFFKKSGSKGEVRVWENRAMEAHGGRWQKGDGVFWGDMTGSGFDDYIWISAFGQVNIFPNKNQKENFDWYKTNAWGTVQKYETGFSRRALHIGDWDGDGKADIIGVDRASGMLTVWYTKWDGKTFTFRKEVQTATSGRCTLGWGVLYHDTAHHFADLDGNGKVDYICVHKDGYMTATLNLDNTQLSYKGQIKYGEDLDRANFKFADVNGDGLDDMLHIDKFTGAARVFYNQGPYLGDPKENSGSAWKWERPTAAYTGTSRGPNMHYPTLSGLGRADMVEVDPNTAHGWVSFNECEGGGGDDSDTGKDPGLPSYSPGEPEEPSDPGKHWFCDTNPGAWDPQMWIDYGMGDWLIDRTAWYSSSERQWPETKASNGVPRVIAEYDYLEHDTAFVWPGPQCQGIRYDCSLSVSDLNLKTPECKNNWRRAFSLWSMRNLALYMQAYHHDLLESAVFASFDNSLLATSFIDGSDVELNEAAWLTIAAGMATAFSAAIPGGPTQAAGNAVAGLLTVAAGVFAATSQPQDLRLDRFADLEHELSKITRATQASVESYFKRLIIERPPNHDIARGTELATLIQGGAMADQDFSIPDSGNIDHDLQLQLIRAPLLSEIWNAQNVFVVKFGEHQLYYDRPNIKTPFEYSPCNGINNIEDLYAFNACPGDGNNYMIVRWDKTEEGMFTSKIGTAAETVAKLDFTKEQIVRVAENIQARTGEYTSHNVRSIEQHIRNVASNNKPDPEDALWLNLVVCDLTKITEPLDYGNAYADCQKSSRIQGCLQHVIYYNCPKVALPGKEWPF
ncbi:carbohydrate esterase family 3 [Fusarium heterosporum]|uniref:Carbohydrate esterase family 3 n=1 Tax=Fusarium heterosporum TaxID=42747 RepID=A0A8H5WVK5_FUSHE|nr:carbohydrate esterase family 3 [Fusarium heterosporum]